MYTYTFHCGMPFQHPVIEKEREENIMGRIGDFFYHLIIVILVAAALVFLLMAFKEQYPIWKNQQELDNLRSKVEKKKTKMRIHILTGKI
ncbi:hypothetical protein NIA73_13780 [Anaerobutyricum hallii]|nr:hypothetical protein [Anaerobutyricum hallii]